MDLLNFTPYPALLTRFGASTDMMGSTLVARVTYEIRGSALVIAGQQRWPVSPAPWECPFGPMDPDDAFYKGGVDVFVFGHARTPSRRPMSQLRVGVEIGRFRRELIIFGARAWLPRGRTLVASAPQPFLEMPLAMQNAFGGTAEWDGLQVPCMDNPAGKGFYLEIDQALGHELPNIEDPSRPIKQWTDRPVPAGVGICPPAFSTRLSAGATFTPAGALASLNGRLFNAAYPEMVAEAVRSGDSVRLTGVRHEGDVLFTVPEGPVMFRLRLGHEEIIRLPAIDQIGVDVDAGQVFITYRYPFRYVLYAQQRRSAELLPASQEFAA